MPSTLDTPARAARAPRPQTRAWRHMLSEAAAQTSSAAAVREQLRNHLAAADRLATRRTNSTTPPPRAAPHPLQVLHSLDTDWSKRVDALSALRASPAAYDLSPATPWLALQLSDLRSRVVGAASDAVAAAAAARCLDAGQAAELFAAAAAGANVSKKVMADARRAAALAALHAQTDPALFERVAAVASGAPHPAARKLAVDALVEAVDDAARAADLAESVTTALVSAATDKAADVRAAARALAAAFEKRFGEVEWGNVLSALPADAAGRLKTAEPVVGPGVATGAAKGKPASGIRTRGGAVAARGSKARTGMRELIRQRREALKKQKAVAGGGEHNEAGEEKSRKRTSSQVKLDGRTGSTKRGVLARIEKGNVPDAAP